MTAHPTTDGPAEVGNVFVSNYPPFSCWDGRGIGALDQALAAPPRPDTPLGLYLHIPFCRKRCKFCYFRVYTDRDARQIARYLDALAEEVRTYSERPAIVDRPLRFVYFGGGTPSYISVDHLRKLVGELQAAIPWDGAAEITFECEPGTLTEAKLEAIRDLGITRLSLGIESFDDEILKENGRAHLQHEIQRVRPWIRRLGFPQLNVDLIAGMVGETWDTWRDSVQKTVDYDPQSVTIYQLELPYNTVFTRDLANGELSRPLAGWEDKRAWHDWAFAQLEAAGYELSSAYTMVKKGSGARFVYRDTVWHGGDMLGTGVASFSHLSGVHFQNHDSWGDYLEATEAGELPVRRAFPTGARERLTREMILQLKLGRIARQPFQDKFGENILETFGPAFSSLAAADMLTVAADGVTLTRKGLLQVDSLLPTFYEDRYRDTRYT